MTTTVASVAELTALTGKHLGYSEWREITQEQINTFAKLYPHDVRPVQPLNGRVVEESR